MASSPPAPPKVQKTTFTYKTDIRKSQFDSHPRCGILHAFRSSPDHGGREEQSFSWVADYDVAVDPALAHLERYGFMKDKVQFIPFSSRTNWVTKYPHAFPYVDCDEGGNVTGFPYWSPHAQSALEIPPEVVHIAAEPSTADAISRGAAVSSLGVRGRPSQQLLVKQENGGIGNGKQLTKKGLRLNDTLLTNSERNQLHNEIYNYFSWLTDKVVECETTDQGRRAVKKADMSVASLRGLLIKLESTFKSVSHMKRREAEKKEAEGEGGDEEMKDEESPETLSASVPMLESSLMYEMANKAYAEELTQKEERAKNKAERKKNAHWEPLDFETMFDKLITYKSEHGHPNVPVKYQKDIHLGGWVSGLRTKKKAYEKDDGDADPDPDADADTSMDLDQSLLEAADLTNMEEDGVPNNSPNKITHPNQMKYLTSSRIERLESIGFSWTMNRPKTKSKSWDERLENLQTWHIENDTWKVPRATSLGEWLHNQRTLYGKRDKKFMSRKYQRMVDIGYQFDLRESMPVSWEDRFQQLVEFQQLNGNFDVPTPVSDDMDDGSVGADKLRFYKWVNRLHNEYRAYEKGTTSKLNDERVEKLNGINFHFKGPKMRGRPSTGNVSIVPSLPWEKRLQQMVAFKNDTGHMNIDHNYKHCSNLGGWAADMSTLYKNWKAGSQQLSADMIAKFNQLTAVGFEFNILPYYENNRSWEDHYAVLVKFRNETGTARVPLKYKADLRLGKWVQSQRQQYKLLVEGKKSKMSQERISLLEETGFEWAVAGSGKEDEDEQQDLQDLQQDV